MDSTLREDSTPPVLAHLRPLSPIEMVDRSLTLLRLHFPTLGFLALLASLPAIFAIFVPFDASAKIDPSTPPTPQMLFSMMTMVALYLVSIWPEVALVAGCFQALLSPYEPLRFGKLMAFAARRWPAMLLAQILFGFALLILVTSLQVFRGAGAVGGLLSLALTFIAIVAGVRLVLCWPVIVLERRSIFEALQRSYHLTSLGQIPVLGPSGGELDRSPVPRFEAPFPRTILLVMLPAIAVIFFTNALTLLIPEANDSRLALGGLSFLGSFGFSLLSGAAIVVIYTDRIIRKEAWDIELRLVHLEQSAVAEQVQQAASHSPSPNATE